MVSKVNMAAAIENQMWLSFLEAKQKLYLITDSLGRKIFLGLRCKKFLIWTLT